MVLKLCIIAIVCAVIILYLKSINTSLAILCSIASSIILLSFGVDLLSDVFGFFERLSNLANVSISTLKIIIKISLISYVIEFSAGLIEEFGMKSLSDKLVLVGKLVILLLAVPVFQGLLEVVEGLL